MAIINTRIADQPVRSYVLMGDGVNTDKVHPDARLVLYNSAFWGSPVIGAIINSGTVRFQQANFTRSGAPGIDVRGGKAHVYTTYFAQPMTGGERAIREISEAVAAGNNVYAKLHATGISIELTNNYYVSGLGLDTAKPGMIYGSDMVSGNNSK